MFLSKEILTRKLNQQKKMESMSGNVLTLFPAFNFVSTYFAAKYDKDDVIYV